MYAQRELFQFRCVQAVTSGAEASHFQESVPSGRRSRRKNRECAGSFGSGHRTIRSSIGMCIALEKNAFTVGFTSSQEANVTPLDRGTNSDAKVAPSSSGMSGTDFILRTGSIAMVTF